MSGGVTVVNSCFLSLLGVPFYESLRLNALFSVPRLKQRVGEKPEVTRSNNAFKVTRL